MYRKPLVVQSEMDILVWNLINTYIYIYAFTKKYMYPQCIENLYQKAFETLLSLRLERLETWLEFYIRHL